MADPIELDQRVRGTIRPYDTDTFAVNVTRPGARITVDAAKEAVGNYTNLSVTIRSPENEYLGYTQLIGSETNRTAFATARDAGTYYVSVDVNHASFPYEFEVSTSNVDGIPQERNRADATPLAPGEAATGTLTLDAEAWYAVNATAGDELVANFTTDQRHPSGFSLQIHAPNGEFITDAEYREASTVARTNGTYYVYLTRDSREPLDYTLATTVRDTMDPTEPNEDRANATPIETGTTVTGDLAAGDRDWYAFEANRGDRIDLSVDSPFMSGMDILVYGPDGTVLSSSGLFDPSLNLTVDVNRNGTYRVVFRQSDIDMWLLEEVPYDLSVDVTPGAAPPDADGDRLSDAEEAEYGTDPNDPDTDDDRLSDYVEAVQYRLDPVDPDTDGDGLTDYEEVVSYNTDPTETDSDADGWSDRSEVNRGCDPTDPWSHP